ncbi:unnamed protein product [Phyllotreta striolata]|uniref:Uncharacterized protein n=1 Tax=Phyllotreta striolata TaxID=444603 RepID=A0A9N9T9P4_PHYSR|nr:unnamed protein product [Phyllotreta striolata]
MCAFLRSTSFSFPSKFPYTGNFIELLLSRIKCEPDLDDEDDEYESSEDDEDEDEESLSDIESYIEFDIEEDDEEEDGE